MKLPLDNDLIRDYLEWSYRRADALLTAWILRKTSRESARIQYMLATSFKKELDIIRREMTKQ